MSVFAYLLINAENLGLVNSSPRAISATNHMPARQADHVVSTKFCLHAYMRGSYDGQKLSRSKRFITGQNSGGSKC